MNAPHEYFEDTLYSLLLGLFIVYNIGHRDYIRSANTDLKTTSRAGMSKAKVQNDRSKFFR